MDNKNTVFRSLDIIEGRILEKLTIENISSSIHFSKYHYQRMFRDIVGDSVMGYVTKRKLTLAGRELLETDATILDIALMFGYDSHEGFTRSFKAYMGITPTEYRKYHLSAISLKIVKEKFTMLYSKTTDGIIRELNELIVQIKDTADYTRKNKEVKALSKNNLNEYFAEMPYTQAFQQNKNGSYFRTEPNIEASKFYSQFWDFIADKTDAMADDLIKYLDRIAVISQHPDEISARFIIIKAIEDIAFKSHIIALNAGLMISRAMPDYGVVYKPICDKYNTLADSAQIRADKIVEFFNELTSLIFKDMQKEAEQRIQSAIEKGKSAATNLISSADYPYAYIADEIMKIVNELSAMPLVKVSISYLEDYLFRLQVVSFAADTDAFRVPSHKDLFGKIAVFQESINEVMEFFQSLSMIAVQDVEPVQKLNIENDMVKNYSDLALQGNILLFIIKGEIQKMGNSYLTEDQKATFLSIGYKLNSAIQLAHNAADETSFNKITAIICEVYNKMITEADKLGLHGSAIRFIAEEIKRLAMKSGSLVK